LNLVWSVRRGHLLSGHPIGRAAAQPSSANSVVHATAPE